MLFSLKSWAAGVVPKRNNCDDSNGQACRQRWASRKRVMGKHSGNDGQCPDSLPKPIFVIETRSSCGTSKNQTVSNGRLQRSPKKTAEDSIKATNRHPKVTPNHSFWGPGIHPGTRMRPKGGTLSKFVSSSSPEETHLQLNGNPET